MTFQQIIADINRKVYHKVYLLHGDEEYFIDAIVQAIEDNVLDENEKEFNQTIMYGIDVDDQMVVAESKRYPMMANHNVVIVKEAQNLSGYLALDEYVTNSLGSTILVLARKHGKFDGRKKYVKEAKKSGVLFESKKLYDNQIGSWIADFLKTKGYFIDEKAKVLIAESLGTNLSRIVNELTKLMIVEPKGTKINADIVQKNIGINKDYNVFELNNALGSKDILKCNRIVNHFSANDKEYPILGTIPNVYKYFGQLIKYLYLTDKSPSNAASELKINPYFVKDYASAARNYDIRKCVAIMEYLYDADLKAKGITSANLNQGQILKEMVFKILH